MCPVGVQEVLVEIDTIQMVEVSTYSYHKVVAVGFMLLCNPCSVIHNTYDDLLRGLYFVSFRLKPGVEISQRFKYTFIFINILIPRECLNSELHQFTESSNTMCSLHRYGR